MTEPADQRPPEEPWAPPRTRDGNVAGIVVGLVLLGIGVWFLLDFTLGFEMPRIRWGDVWPLILIVIGGVIVYQAMRRRA
jgi:hypothetical protein